MQGHEALWTIYFPPVISHNSLVRMCNQEVGNTIQTIDSNKETRYNHRRVINKKKLPYYDSIKRSDVMMSSFASGPFIEAALLCEKILQEVDGAKSVIRIIDRVVRRIAGPTPPMEMEPFEYELFLFIRFKSGACRGPMQLEVKLIKPSGESPPPATHTLIFEGEDDRGVDVVMGMRIKFEQTGLYWFSIRLQEETITRIPLRIVYIPQTIQIPPARQNP
jgi:hypothetical protein